ncbi:MAG: cytochrome c peroxidase [Bacteroidota bacterium]
MRTNGIPLLLFALFVLSFSSCVKDNVDSDVNNFHYSDSEYTTLQKSLNLPEFPLDYRVNLPQHFHDANAQMSFISNTEATLGRVLFYDKALSRNSSVSCASCHAQSRAFADPVALSEGFEGRLTKRNSFALGAVASFEATYGSGGGFPSNRGNIFWDNRASTIQEQSTQTLQDPIEMGMDMDLLEERVSSKDYYKVLFKKAYGTDRITSSLILEAIAEFINSMVTSESRFDKGLAKAHSNPFTDFDNFTQQENLGKLVYMNSCSGCHGSNFVQVEETSASNGLDQVYSDEGIGGISGLRSDKGVFKVPMLRNIELTAPYMHDGRFETLEEVVDHYSSGIQAHDNLHHFLKAGGDPVKMDFTGEEKAALIAFMRTLTDNTFTSAERFSDPFKN